MSELAYKLRQNVPLLEWTGAFCSTDHKEVYLTDKRHRLPVQNLNLRVGAIFFPGYYMIL